MGYGIQRGVALSLPRASLCLLVHRLCLLLRLLCKCISGMSARVSTDINTASTRQKVCAHTGMSWCAPAITSILTRLSRLAWHSQPVPRACMRQAAANNIPVCARARSTETRRGRKTAKTSTHARTCSWRSFSCSEPGLNNRGKLFVRASLLVTVTLPRQCGIACLEGTQVPCTCTCPITPSSRAPTQQAPAAPRCAHCPQVTLPSAPPTLASAHSIRSVALLLQCGCLAHAARLRQSSATACYSSRHLPHSTAYCRSSLYPAVPAYRNTRLHA